MIMCVCPTLSHNRELHLIFRRPSYFTLLTSDFSFFSENRRHDHRRFLRVDVRLTEEFRVGLHFVLPVTGMRNCSSACLCDIPHCTYPVIHGYTSMVTMVTMVPSPWLPWFHLHGYKSTVTSPWLQVHGYQSVATAPCSFCPTKEGVLATPVV